MIVENMFLQCLFSLNLQYTVSVYTPAQIRLISVSVNYMYMYIVS